MSSLTAQEWKDVAMKNLEEINRLKEENEELKEENEELLEINERDRDYCDGERDPIGISQEEKDQIIISLVQWTASKFEKQVVELKEENQKLKDFTHWENHPALRNKVVLDDDYYLELKKE